MSDVAVQWIIHGRVQGVGYRAFARRAAGALGVRGTVRNRSDGTVEVRAKGAPDTLEALRERLREGPSWATVDRIEAGDPPPGPLPAGFEIRL